MTLVSKGGRGVNALNYLVEQHLRLLKVLIHRREHLLSLRWRFDGRRRVWLPADSTG
jgi:hypothetical protein